MYDKVHYKFKKKKKNLGLKKKKKKRTKRNTDKQFPVRNSK